MKKKIKPKAVPFTPITSDEEILNFIHSLTGKKKEDTIIGEARGLTHFQISVIRQVFGKTEFTQKYHSEETIRGVIDDYQNGDLVNGIAKKYSISVSAVYGILEREGIDRSRKEPWTKFRCERLVKLKEVDRLKWADIAKYMGMTISAAHAHYKSIKIKQAQEAAAKAAEASKQPNDVNE